MPAIKYRIIGQLREIGKANNIPNIFYYIGKRLGIGESTMRGMCRNLELNGIGNDPGQMYPYQAKSLLAELERLTDAEPVQKKIERGIRKFEKTL